ANPAKRAGTFRPRRQSLTRCPVTRTGRPRSSSRRARCTDSVTFFSGGLPASAESRANRSAKRSRGVVASSEPVTCPYRSGPENVSTACKQAFYAERSVAHFGCFRTRARLRSAAETGAADRLQLGSWDRAAVAVCRPVVLGRVGGPAQHHSPFRGSHSRTKSHQAATSATASSVPSSAGLSGSRSRGVTPSLGHDRPALAPSPSHPHDPAV